MKTQETQQHGEAALLEQIKTLQSQLDDCYERSSKDASTASDAAQIGWLLEDHMNYLPGYCSSYYELMEAVERDLSLLGRVGHDVTFAHLQRTGSTVDYSAEQGGGKHLADEQYEELFFFIDKISSVLFALKGMYQNMHRSGIMTELGKKRNQK